MPGTGRKNKKLCSMRPAALFGLGHACHCPSGTFRPRLLGQEIITGPGMGLKKICVRYGLRLILDWAIPSTARDGQCYAQAVPGMAWNDSPLLLYLAALPFATALPFCSHCFHSIGLVATSTTSAKGGPLPCPSCASLALFCSPRYLSLTATSSHPAWLCCAFLSLPSLPADLHASILFLLAASSPSEFLCLLSLEGALHDAPEAIVLHSFLASVLPPPLPFGFSQELTAALLAKDKMNAFGLMELF